jgi:NADH:ubiquinone reductase (H+-translocating)
MTDNTGTITNKRPRVVIVGGGFGGLYAARTFHNAPIDITLIDRTNHHVFQPLLYQVATASLAPEQITAPLRSVLRNQKNTEVLMAEVTGVDTAARRVYMRDKWVEYDYLILTTGSRHSYFKHPEWERFAPGLKAISDANSVRRELLLAFEAAEMETDEAKRRRLLTFVLVGGGPTGVEMAGQIAEISHRAFTRDFRHITPNTARILLVEAGPRILPGFHESLAAASQKYLEGLGVEVWTGKSVENVTSEGVTVGEEFIPAGAVVWAAGNITSPVGKWTGAETDKTGRVKVCPDLSVPGLPTVFIIGDAMFLEQDGKPLPGVAQVPIQQGKYVAKLIQRRVEKQLDLPPFRYFDKGNMATVGRKFAIYDLDELRTLSGKRIAGPLRFYGFWVWVLWLMIHITYLVGFANRYLVIWQWAWSYITFQRSARLITPDAGPNIADPSKVGAPMPPPEMPASTDGTPGPEHNGKSAPPPQPKVAA